MDPPDSAQVEEAPALVAESIPLPPSPPPHDEPMPSIMAQLSLRDPLDENRARSADGEHLDSPAHAERAADVEDPGAPPPTPPAKPVPSNPASPVARRPNVPPHIPLSPRAVSGASLPSTDSRPATPNGRAPPSRQSTDSQSHKRSLTLSKGNTVSVVLISSALETIAAHKEAKRSAPLRESVQRALEMVKSGQGGDRPREIFEPLRLACETRNEKLMIASLDCISKLISYSFFAETSSSTHAPTSPPPSPGPNSRGSMQAPREPTSLVDLVVHTITACHTESTPETVSLQIVKALLALVLSPTVLVHQSSLLKAVRTVYNVFLLSVDPVNQMVAQGGLTQMVNHVFARCKIGLSSLPQSDSATTLSTRDGPDSARSSKRPSLVSSPRNSLPLPPSSPSINGSEAASSTLVEEPSEASSSAVSVAQTETTEEALDEDAHSESRNNGIANSQNGIHHQPYVVYICRILFLS